MGPRSPQREKKRKGVSAQQEAQRRAPKKPLRVVGIGASAGGLEAISELLSHLRPDTGMAFVFIEHLGPEHESILPQILTRKTIMPVSEIRDGMAVRANQVYVIPSNRETTIAHGLLHLKARTAADSPFSPIDSFFQSLAKDRGAASVGVILSGTASDGVAGCGAIKHVGGTNLAQQPDTAKYGDMPRNAQEAGFVDYVLPLKGIAAKLAEIARRAPPVSAAQKILPVHEEGLDEIFGLLRQSTGVDFAHYKRSTMQRRLQRRMDAHNLHSYKDYLAMVRRTPGELDELFRDVLIHVTSFFRDAGAFTALRKFVFPGIVKGHRADEPIRIWVPGCSTGEEAYSIVIALLEYLRTAPPSRSFPNAGIRPVQLFATDISDAVLARARAAVFPASIAKDVPAALLRRYFTRHDADCQVVKSVRELCVFARQNVTQDPPFPNMDLISCRNLLIYLEPELQNRVLPILHFSLRTNGFLLLGGSERLVTYSEYFALVDKKQKIFQKKKIAAPPPAQFFAATHLAQRKPRPPEGVPTPPPLNLEKEVDRLLLAKYVPASIVVNDAMEIVRFRGHTGPYLEPAPGHPGFTLSKMVRQGLLVHLRAAIEKAKRSKGPVRKLGIRVRSNGSTREVNLLVIPILAPVVHDRHYVVIFEEEKRAPVSRAAGKKAAGKQKLSPALAQENRRLRQDLAEAQHNLQAIIEDHEATLEEFKSSNEEVLSSNEELQSTNEELETTKEELQSSNEELVTLNEELINRNTELTLANSDTFNLLANANIPIVLVGSDLRIRRFTPGADKILNLQPGDVGRRLGDIRPNLSSDDLERRARECMATLTPVEVETQDINGAWHLLRVRPYRTKEERVEGVVISVVDIDAMKRLVEEARIYASATIETATDPLLILDEELRITTANPAFYAKYQLSPKKTLSRLFFDLPGKHWRNPRLRQLIEEIIPRESSVDDFEIEQEIEGVGKRTILVSGRRIGLEKDRPTILIAIRDITEQIAHSETTQRQALLLEIVPDAIYLTDLDDSIRFWNRGAERVHGWTSAQALGKPAHVLLRTEFPESNEATVAAVIREGHWEGEVTQYARDGSRRTLISRRALQRDANGAPRGILVVNSDITEQKTADEAIRRQAELLNLAPTAILVRDLEGRTQFWSRGAEELYGYTKEETLGKVTHKLLHAEFAESHDAVWNTALRTGHWEGEIRQTCKDGRRIVVSSCWALQRDADGSPAAMLLINTDITQQKAADQALREQATLLELAHDAIFVRELGGTIRFWNRGAEVLYGWTRDQALGKTSHELLHTEFPVSLNATLEALRRDGFWEGELWQTRRDGERILVASRWSLQFNADGMPGAILEICTDITQSRQAEEQLRANEEKFRSVVDAASDAVILAEEDGRILHFNASAEKIFGYSAAEAVGQPLTLIMPERFHQHHQKAFQRYVKTGEGRLIGKTVEMMGRRKDGAEFDVELSLAAWRSGGRKYFVGMLRDITARKQAERKFRGLLESAPDASVIVGADGKIALINSQTEALFGYQRKELLGQPVETLIPERFHGVHLVHRAAYFSSPRSRPMGAGLELFGRRKDGSEFPV
ncbi:MAG TPA: PAS domain S-box protein, partial [Candidatus Acidoferrales bacterium]|nr:PAS domain S-box protein [Candidatus Acidoferrales bacterium]